MRSSKSAKCKTLLSRRASQSSVVDEPVDLELGSDCIRKIHCLCRAVFVYIESYTLIAQLITHLFRDGPKSVLL